MKNRSAKNNTKRPYQEPRKAKSVTEMSEQELLAIGYRTPLVYKFDFSKTKEEKAKLKKVHHKVKTRTPGLPRTGRTELVANLILHVKPNSKTENFKSTHTFKAKASEVGYIINTLIGNETVTKAWYNGKPYKIAA